jgi:hypothetical protein
MLLQIVSGGVPIGPTMRNWCAACDRGSTGNQECAEDAVLTGRRDGDLYRLQRERIGIQALMADLDVVDVGARSMVKTLTVTNTGDSAIRVPMLQMTDPTFAIDTDGNACDVSHEKGAICMF